MDERERLRRVVPTVRWLETDGMSALAELDVDAGLAVFDGHFEGSPIVPGVAQVAWVMALAPTHLPVPPRGTFLRMEILKFQAVIVPGSVVRLALAWLPERHALTFRLTSPLGQHASGRIVFQMADQPAPVGGAAHV